LLQQAPSPCHRRRSGCCGCWRSRRWTTARRLSPTICMVEGTTQTGGSVKRTQAMCDYWLHVLKALRQCFRYFVLLAGGKRHESCVRG
jgi:hypothetical protein